MLNFYSSLGNLIFLNKTPLTCKLVTSLKFLPRIIYTNNKFLKISD